MFWMSSELIFFDQMSCKMLFVRVFSSWLTFLHKDETCSLKLNMIYFDPWQLFIFVVNNFFATNFLLETFFVLFISKWYLSEFTFILLSVNCCNNISTAFSNLIGTFRIFEPVQYGMISPHSLLQECHGRTKRDHTKI